MSNPSVRDIVAEWLARNGFDGLANVGVECGCSLGDLMPCGAPNECSCVAAYRVPCEHEGEYVMTVEP